MLSSYPLIANRPPPKWPLPHNRRSTTVSPQDEAYLNVKQVAERLGVSTDTIYRRKREGDFPMAVKLSPGVVRWRLSDIL